MKYSTKYADTVIQRLTFEDVQEIVDRKEIRFLSDEIERIKIAINLQLEEEALKGWDDDNKEWAVGARCSLSHAVRVGRLLQERLGDLPKERPLAECTCSESGIATARLAVGNGVNQPC